MRASDAGGVVRGNYDQIARCGHEWGPVEGERTPCGTPVDCPHSCKLHPGHIGNHYCCPTYVGDDWTPAERPA